MALTASSSLFRLISFSIYATTQSWTVPFQPISRAWICFWWESCELRRMRSVPTSSAQHSASVKEAGKIGQREKYIPSKLQLVPETHRKCWAAEKSFHIKYLIEHLLNIRDAGKYWAEIETARLMIFFGLIYFNGKWWLSGFHVERQVFFLNSMWRVNACGPQEIKFSCDQSLCWKMVLWHRTGPTSDFKMIPFVFMDWRKRKNEVFSIFKSGNVSQKNQDGENSHKVK